MSIQLLLLFITPTNLRTRHDTKQFQYNSCYCLSFVSFLPNLYPDHFNTTLVIVYQKLWRRRTGKWSFQYNSCYCLSKEWRRIYSVHVRISIQLLLLFISFCLCFPSLPLQFQYNSCYCLSNAFKPFLFFIIASFPDKINVSFVFSQLICFFVFPSLN